MPFSTLIVYEPLESLLENKEYWTKYVKFYENYWGGPTSPFGMWFGNEYASFKKALSEHINLEEDNINDCLFMKDDKGNYFIAPMGDSVHMFSVENIIPLEWFALFSEDERKDFLSHWGFNSIHYDSTLKQSLERISESILNLDDKELIDLSAKNSLKPFIQEFIKSMKTLSGWLKQFDQKSYIILNYGDICTHIQPHTLKNENSVRDINSLITSIKTRNFDEAELNLKIFFQKWDDIRNKCIGQNNIPTIQ